MPKCKQPQETRTQVAHNWGKVLMLLAILLNSILIFVNWHVSELDASRAGKREEERYFITNNQSLNLEDAKRLLLHASLNQQKLLRRLASGLIAPKEKEMLLLDEKTFQSATVASFRKITAVSYLQGNDPPSGLNLEKKFSKYSEVELGRMLPEFENQASGYIMNVKKEMLSLESKISFWKKVSSQMLLFSTILMLIANFLLFYSSKTDG